MGHSARVWVVYERRSLRATSRFVALHASTKAYTRVLYLGVCSDTAIWASENQYCGIYRGICCAIRYTAIVDFSLSRNPFGVMLNPVP